MYRASMQEKILDPFLIAEIGINHNGDLELAKQLILEAKDAGFNAVKFQKRSVEIVYSQLFLNSPRESPWGKTQRDQKNGLEFSKIQYDEIDRICKEVGIHWFASAWDLESQYFLAQYDLAYNKIASPLLGHKPLLKRVASEKKLTFISTGMSTLNEIDEVVEIFRNNNCPFELMHCNSTYPMKETDANLLCIPLLRSRYGVNVGYSGHESSLIKVCVAAVALGATSLERHITLDRTMYGSDQASSIEVYALKNFVDSIRKVPLILGSGEKNLSASELEARKKLRIEVEE